MLTTLQLTIGYTHKFEEIVVQKDLNLSLAAGEFVCLIGQNGSGKSTLLRTLSGLQPALNGKIQIGGKDITQISQQEKARLLALVLTDRVIVENTTVRQLTALGRQPHTSWWGALSSADNELVEKSLQMVGIEALADKMLTQISDGELQRAMIARTLAQDTPLIMLDEPTAHLDLPNRVAIMQLLHRLAEQTQKIILLSTHELDIALQAADRIWLIDKKLPLKSGLPEDLVLDGSFTKVFDSKNYFFNKSNGNFSMNYPLTKDVALDGDNTYVYWTMRALARNGFRVTENADIKIFTENNYWTLNDEKFETLEEMLNQLNFIYGSPQ